MTTTVESNTQIDTRVLDTLPPTSTGVIPRVGQFVALFREGVVSAGWLIEEPREQEPDTVGLVHLEGQLLTADGVVLFARSTRQEWLDAERDNRDPSADVLFRLHRRSKNELAEIVSDAHTYADDNELCPEFDRFLEEHNLPSRNDRVQYPSVRVTATVTVSGTGRTEEDAYENLDREQVFEALRETMTNYPQSVDYELD